MIWYQKLFRPYNFNSRFNKWLCCIRSSRCISVYWICFHFAINFGSSFEISLFQIKSSISYVLIISPLRICYMHRWNWLFVIWKLSMVYLLVFNSQISQEPQVFVCFAFWFINSSPLDLITLSYIFSISIYSSGECAAALLHLL